MEPPINPKPRTETLTAQLWPAGWPPLWQKPPLVPGAIRHPVLPTWATEARASPLEWISVRAPKVRLECFAVGG